MRDKRSLQKKEKLPPKPDFNKVTHKEGMAYLEHPEAVKAGNRKLRNFMLIYGSVLLTLVGTIGVMKYQIDKEFEDTREKNMPAFIKWADEKMNLPMDELILQLDTIFAQIENNYFKIYGIDSLEKKIKNDLPIHLSNINQEYIDKIQTTLGTLKEKHPESYKNLLKNSLQQEIIGNKLNTSPYWNDEFLIRADITCDSIGTEIWIETKDITHWNLMSKIYDAYGFENKDKKEEKVKTISVKGKKKRGENDPNVEVSLENMIERLAFSKHYDNLSNNEQYQSLIEKETKLENQIESQKEKIKNEKIFEIRELRKNKKSEISNVKYNLSYLIQNPTDVVLKFAEAKYIQKAIRLCHGDLTELKSSIKELSNHPEVNEYKKQLIEAKEINKNQKKDINLKYQNEQIVLNVKYKNKMITALGPMPNELKEVRKDIERITKYHAPTYDVIKAKLDSIAQADSLQIQIMYHEAFLK